MVFPVVGGDGKPTGYEISNSLMFNDGDASILQRTAVANTGEDNATLSFWFKIANLKTDNNGGTIMTEGGTSGNHIVQLYAQKIYIGSGAFGIMFPNLIRDPSAWYHLFIAFDTSQSTDTNRVKAYLNGVLLTDATGFTDYPDQNENLGLCVNGNTTRIGGRGNSGPAENFDGYLAEFHFLDGTTKAYTDFGEFDDNGVWIPKQYTGGSYGNNGFYLEFKQTGTSANSSGIGADTSGEDHHFSLATGNNAFDGNDIMTDSPTNNFPTWNPLQQNAADPMSGFGQGNLSVTEGSNADWSTCTATQAVANGKWYFEVRINNLSGSVMVGVLRQAYASTTLAKTSNAYMGSNSGDLSFGYRENGTFYYNGSTDSGNTTFGSNDIVMIALDMDNGAIYAGRNGTWQDGGDPTSGSSKTGASYTGISAGEFYSPAVSGSASDFDALGNFGNVHGQYSMSSANTDGLYGEFEYAPPSGYYAICTKRIAEYG
jgi:hypothetical protein